MIYIKFSAFDLIKLTFILFVKLAGAWSDVGAAADIGMTSEFIKGFRAITPAHGILALEKIMSSVEVQIIVSEVGDVNVVKSIFRQGNYLDEMKSDKLDEDKFKKFDHIVGDILKDASSEERREKVQIYIAVILKQTLNLPENEVLDIDQNFSELGVDSLMAMEIKNRLSGIVENKTLSMSSLQENRTIRSLSTHLVKVLDETHN